MPAKAAVAAWLGMSGQHNSRIETLYQAMEDQDMPALRAILEAIYTAGWTDGLRSDPNGAQVFMIPATNRTPPLIHSIGAYGE